MTKQELATTQAEALRTRLVEEFPGHIVWAQASNYYFQVDYHVDDQAGGCSARRFPDAIEEIVDSVRAALG